MAKKNVNRPEFVSFEEKSARQCFMEAVDALEVFKGHPKDLSQVIGVRAIIEAFKRVHESQQKFRREWEKEHPDYARYREFFSVDDATTVATALWHVTEGDGLSPEEVGIPCVGATPLVCFGRACMLAELSMELSSRLDECNEEGSILYVDDEGAGIIINGLSADMRL